MSLQNAIDFLSAVDSNHDFRKSCYEYKSKEALLLFLEDEGYSFSIEEISEAFNVLLFKCQAYEQHENVRHLQNWFTLFI